MAAKSKHYIDRISTLEGGMVGGRDPILLNRNEAAFLLNATVRGGFAKCRPPFKKREIVFPDDDTQVAVERGLFQGSCYYKPDVGNQCLIAQISGRLFRFDADRDQIICSEITIPGDPNPSDVPVAWLWQADKWVIVNNGQDLPIFYDGANSRRSYGASVSLGTVNDAASQRPEIGSTVDLTLDADWGGLYDIPVLLNGEYYQPQKIIAGYKTYIQILANTTGDSSIAEGAVAKSAPQVVGVASSEYQTYSNANSVPAGVFVFQLQLAYGSPYSNIAVGDILTVGSQTSTTGGNIFRNNLNIRLLVASVGSGTIQVSNADALTGQNGRFGVGFRITANSKLYNKSINEPSIDIGTVSVAVSDLNQGYITFGQRYTGAPCVSWIGGVAFFITNSGGDEVAPATTVRLVNLSDGSTPVAGQFDNMVIYSVPELTAGRCGSYGLGQNWMSLTDGLTFVVSDIARGPSGTVAQDRRDAILKTVDMTYGGGKFAIPSSGGHITSIIFAPKLDASLGQGPVQIGTQFGVFTADAPVDLQALLEERIPSPIAPEILKGRGPMGQNSTILVNSDTFFRALDGINSLVLARRDFGTWGNTPVSDEVNDRILGLDEQTLLQYSSGAFFNDRAIFTASPQSSPNGVLHAAMVAINVDAVSSLRGKTPPCWDGLWTGVNVMQFVHGLFNGSSRQFAWTYNVSQQKLELWELLNDGDGYFDNDNYPIVWGLESRALFSRDTKPEDEVIRLTNGEIAVDQVVGRVNFRVWYRADQGCWKLWRNFTICSDRSGNPGYFPRIGLGEPSSSDEAESVDRPAREGNVFQVKFQITGHCRLLRAKFEATLVDVPEFATPECP